MDDSLIIEIWDTFKEYITDKNKDIAANHYVDFLLGHDIDESTLEEFLGFDPHLDEAIQTVLDERDSETVDEDEIDFDEEY